MKQLLLLSLLFGMMTFLGCEGFEFPEVTEEGVEGRTYSGERLLKRRERARRRAEEEQERKNKEEQEGERSLAEQDEPASAEGESVRCEDESGKVRAFTLFEPGRNGELCELLDKDGEVIWYATNQATYCRNRFNLYIERAEQAGFSCL